MFCVSKGKLYRFYLTAAGVVPCGAVESLSVHNHSARFIIFIFLGTIDSIPVRRMQPYANCISIRRRVSMKPRLIFVLLAIFVPNDNPSRFHFKHFHEKKFGKN